jgi:Excreted virulence factor EspC, type VII ESX diderm
LGRQEGLVTVRVESGALRSAGSEVRRVAADVAPGPAARYQDGVELDDAGGSAQLVQSVASFADEWRSALAWTRELVDHVGVLAGVAAGVYEAEDRAMAEAFGAAGDGLRRPTDGAS